MCWHSKDIGFYECFCGFKILPVGILGVPAVRQPCEVFGDSEAGITNLCWDKFEVKDGRPCRAEKSASSRLADKRCSWEVQLGTEEIWWINTTDKRKEKKTVEICYRVLLNILNLPDTASFLGLFVRGNSCFSAVDSSVDSSEISLASRFFLLSDSELLLVVRGWQFNVFGVFPLSDECPAPVSFICAVFSVTVWFLLRHGEFWDCPSILEDRSLEACGFSPSPCLPNIPSLLIIPFCRIKRSIRLFSWGLGRGWQDEVNGTPVKGSFGGRPQVASLFWCSSSVVLSTDTPLGSSMGSIIISWVIGSRNSSGMETLLESDKKQTDNYQHCKIIFYY